MRAAGINEERSVHRADMRETRSSSLVENYAIDANGAERYGGNGDYDQDGFANIKHGIK